MHESTKRVSPQSKSYTSMQNNLKQVEELKNNFDYKKHSVKRKEDLVTFQSLTHTKYINVNESNNSENVNETIYMTSEKYHSLNKKYSDKSVIRSTSTFFYDLDSIAKRHSYHCVTDITEEKNNTQKEIKNGFGAKSEAIVQECATQMKPRLLASKNTKETKKKSHKVIRKDLSLSSEIFLRDHDCTSCKPSLDDNPINNDRHQKFWSFAKYRTEYTNPSTDQKNLKKNDRGKRTEDPCPCQLFSYACPCTNSKSLTELAKNSKSLTVADQITSTPQEFLEEHKCKHKSDKINNKTSRGNKRTGTNDIIERKSEEKVIDEVRQTNIYNNIVSKKSEKDVITYPYKMKLSRKQRQVLCPNCKEMIEVVSTIEEEESFQSKSSPPLSYGDDKLPAMPLYKASQDPKDTQSKLVESRDICTHEPQCELVPVCQILPTDNIYVNENVSIKQSPVKSTPRVIRVTKGCRHHPPCTVVPSCQRINVLNNNCEYIPPCLHHPRCVNLPLCAPLSKSIYYDEPVIKPEEDLGQTECLHLHDIRCMPNHPIEKVEKQMNRQNTCELLSECHPRYVLNSTLGCISPLPSPCQPISHYLCEHCKSEKSCQYDFLDRNFASPVTKSLSNEDVIFIRDVGCQFRNKNYSPNDSILQTKTSSGSYNINADRYETHYHTLRYEDKFTIPLSVEELSVSTVTFSSTEIDSQCPTHGKQHKRDSIKGRSTGFTPKSNVSPFVGYSYPTANFCLSANGNFKEKTESNKPPSQASVCVSKKQQSAFLVKSRSGFFKGKYKNVFPLKNRRKASQNSCIRITKKMCEV